MKKFLVTVLSVALLLSTTACGTNSELEELKQENEQLKAQLEESSESTEKPTEKPPEKPTEKPTEKVEEQKTSDTQANSDASYELTAGNYEIPADIPAGKYDIVAVSGSGNFTIKREDGHIQTSERLGVDADDEFYIKEYKNAKLLDGKALEISGTLKVQLNPKD